MQPMHEMDVAFAYLVICKVHKWTATTAHEKVELRTVPLDTIQQLMQLLDGVMLPHQLYGL